MKISICDDEEIQLSLIGSYMNEYISIRKLDIKIEKFINPDDLLKHEQNFGGSEIYLLDIVMDNMDGIKLGHKIREYNKKALIIYLTTSKEFSLDAFSVNAFSYFVKPFEKEKLFAELDKCFKYYIPPKKEETVIAVKTSEGTVPVALSKINAVEYLDHHLIYDLTDGSKIISIYQKASFDIQTKFLSVGAFIKTANCYLVNMDNIMAVTSHGFKMKNGEEYPITRKYSDAKVKFLNAKIKKRL